jgi:ATP-binding cassette, subfamily B (MDR/TAP), member 1
MTIIFGQFTTQFTEFGGGEDEQKSREQFRDNADRFVLWFIYLFVGRFVVAYLATETASVGAVRVTRTIRKTFLSTVLRQEVGRFDDNMANGSIASQVTTNGIRINQGIAEKLTILVQAIAMFFSAFVVALVIQWKLALITACIIPAILTVAIVCITIDARFESRIVLFHSQAAVLAQQALSTIKNIHAFWAQKKMVNHYDKYLTDAHKLGSKKSPNIGLANSVFYFCMFAGTALAFWQGFRMYAAGEIQGVGTVLTVILSINIGASSMSIIAPQLASVANAAAAAAELFTIIDKPSKLDPMSSEGDQPDTCVGNIQIRNLAFAYPSRPGVKVLRSLNLDIPAGKTTALVGASGCGKSTLVGLLERWYERESGDILLDGKDIREYNVKWLRSRIRIVQQEPVLFRGSIFENVAKGLVGAQLDLSHEQKLALVQDACRLSNAHDFVEKLPNGYDTQVGERASMLSGGQKQRLVIARSVISNPQILLLDEATSALDPRAEGIVQDALNKVSVNKTTLTIAHKLSTIQSADHIVVMNQGEVVEQGTHQGLLQMDGQYAALVKAQHLGDVSNSNSNSDDNIDRGDDDQPLVDAAVLEKTQTSSIETAREADARDLSAGTVNYGLLRCLKVMLGEQKNLRIHFLMLVIACLIGGGSYPAQAVLYSRLINVFSLPRQEARDQCRWTCLEIERSRMTAGY